MLTVLLSISSLWTESPESFSHIDNVCEVGNSIWISIYQHSRVWLLILRVDLHLHHLGLVASIQISAVPVYQDTLRLSIFAGLINQCVLALSRDCRSDLRVCDCLDPD
jgi:hypothetical protein